MKFGTIIDTDVPVVLFFYAYYMKDHLAMQSSLRDLKCEYGDKIKIAKIPVNKNEDLSQALRIKTVPTVMIYYEGEMIVRRSDIETIDELIVLIEEIINKL